MKRVKPDAPRLQLDLAAAAKRRRQSGLPTRELEWQFKGDPAWNR